MTNQAQRAAAAKKKAEQAEETVAQLTRANQLLIEQIAELSKQIAEMRAELTISKGAGGAAGGADHVVPQPAPASTASSQGKEQLV